ncbi:hypothetical protein [Nodosilinea nodulosa]|uniref:hypothetical protein n=1 Tax=Nodosilinea nodulosa TaxID=416001 RepID=UPI0003087D56|nr:hypothetical protein [Nodosilinea nodulosa]
MAQHLKRWESPRRSGRNHKGRGGSARQRQLQKRQQTLRKRLSGRSQQEQQDRQKGEPIGSPFCWASGLEQHSFSQSAVLLQGIE